MVKRSEAEARWPKLKPEPVREEDVVGMSGQTDIGVTVTSYLLAGPLLFGGIAFLIGLWLDQRWIVAIGILAGMALSMYVIWVRYGAPETSGDTPSTTSSDRR